MLPKLNCFCVRSTAPIVALLLMTDHNQSASVCKSLSVAKDVCYVRFGGQSVSNSSNLPYQTVRGEELILDFDSDGRIVGIELISSDKPCQR